MIVYENPQDTFTEVMGDLNTGDLVIPFANFDICDDDYLAAHNCHRVFPDQCPAGKIRTSYSFARVNGVVTCVSTFIDVPVNVPSITPLQALLWLAGHGKGDADVRALIASISDTTQRLTALAYWDRATTFKHDDPFIAMLWAGLGITASVDQAFTEAAAL